MADFSLSLSDVLVSDKAIVSEALPKGFGVRGAGPRFKIMSNKLVVGFARVQQGMVQFELQRYTHPETRARVKAFENSLKIKYPELIIYKALQEA